MKNNITLSLAFGGIAVALSVSLNLVSQIVMPYLSLPLGGSVTLLRMLPLVIYAYMFGVPRGIFVGFTYGVLDFFTTIGGGYFLSPMQFALDYLIQFALVGLAGLFRNTKSRNKILWGTAVATAGRMLACFVSGLIYFTDFTVLGIWGGVWYSLSYQLLSTFPDMVLVMIAVFILERNKAFMNYIDGIKLKANMIQ